MSIHTLSELERRWPTFNFGGSAFAAIRPAGALTVAQSKSGAGMVLLLGIEVKVQDAWVSAHLSFPPDKSGLGTFTEGHLKIDGGKFLNQYFFSCDENDTWEVGKLTNSPTVKTTNPGKWELLSAELWRDVDKLVTFLAYR
jgi:hypothetical protein